MTRRLLIAALLSNDEPTHSTLHIVSGSIGTVCITAKNSLSEARVSDTKSMTQHSFAGIADAWMNR